MKLRLLACALALVSSFASAQTVHVFVLAGQSNMVGRDATPFGYDENPNILNFSDGRAGSALNQIEVAVDPIRHDKDGVTYGTNAGRPFAETLLPSLPEGDQILLVNRAWGESGARGMVLRATALIQAITCRSTLIRPRSTTPRLHLRRSQLQARRSASMAFCGFKVNPMWTI